MLRMARRGALRGTDPCGRVSSSALRANIARFLLRPRPRGLGAMLGALPLKPRQGTEFPAPSAWLRPLSDRQLGISDQLIRHIPILPRRQQNLIPLRCAILSHAKERRAWAHAHQQIRVLIRVRAHVHLILRVYRHHARRAYVIRMRAVGAEADAACGANIPHKPVADDDIPVAVRAHARIASVIHMPQQAGRFVAGRSARNCRYSPSP